MKRVQDEATTQLAEANQAIASKNETGAALQKKLDESEVNFAKELEEWAQEMEDQQQVGRTRVQETVNEWSARVDELNAEWETKIEMDEVNEERAIGKLRKEIAQVKLAADEAEANPHISNLFSLLHRFSSRLLTSLRFVCVPACLKPSPCRQWPSNSKRSLKHK